jgi:hypothetical protein
MPLLACLLTFCSALDISNCSTGLPAAVFAPDGSLVDTGASTGVPSFIKTVLDRDHEKYDIALKKVRPWRELAREGNIYSKLRVDDERSKNKRAL